MGMDRMFLWTLAIWCFSFLLFCFGSPARIPQQHNIFDSPISIITLHLASYLHCPPRAHICTFSLLSAHFSSFLFSQFSVHFSPVSSHPLACMFSLLFFPSFSYLFLVFYANDTYDLYACNLCWNRKDCTCVCLWCPLPARMCVENADDNFWTGAYTHVRILCLSRSHLPSSSFSFLLRFPSTFVLSSNLSLLLNSLLIAMPSEYTTPVLDFVALAADQYPHQTHQYRDQQQQQQQHQQQHQLSPSTMSMSVPMSMPTPVSPLLPLSISLGSAATPTTTQQAQAKMCAICHCALIPESLEIVDVQGVRNVVCTTCITGEMMLHQYHRRQPQQQQHQHQQHQQHQTEEFQLPLSHSLSSTPIAPQGPSPPQFPSVIVIPSSISPVQNVTPSSPTTQPTQHAIMVESQHVTLSPHSPVLQTIGSIPVHRSPPMPIGENILGEKGKDDDEHVDMRSQEDNGRKIRSTSITESESCGENVTMPDEQEVQDSLGLGLGLLRFYFFNSTEDSYSFYFCFRFRSKFEFWFYFDVDEWRSWSRGYSVATESIRKLSFALGSTSAATSTAIVMSGAFTAVTDASKGRNNGTPRPNCPWPFTTTTLLIPICHVLIASNQLSYCFVFNLST